MLSLFNRRSRPKESRLSGPEIPEQAIDNLRRYNLTVDRPNHHVEHRIFAPTRRPNEKKVSQNPELKQAAGDFVHWILKEGLVVNYGKWFDAEGRGVGDNWITFASEPAAELNIPDHNFRLPLARLEPILTRNAWVVRPEKSSVILTSIDSLPDLEVLIAREDLPSEKKAKLRALYQTIAQRDDSGRQQVMTLVLEADGAWSTRGSYVPTRLTLILPADLGRGLERAIKFQPWLLEAINELLVERAQREADQPEPSHQFARLPSGGDKIIPYSRSQRVWAMFSTGPE